MTKDTQDLNPYDRQVNLWDASQGDPLKEARPLAEINAELNLIPPHRKAEELIDETFVIVAVREQESNFIEQDHYYFCGCLSLDGDKFTTVLGGMAIVELLDSMIAAGNASPIKATLRRVHQGKFGGYYMLE